MKLKRLVSAVLAVGMALTILPTAAFAAGSSTDDTLYVNNLSFIGDEPDTSNWNNGYGWTWSEGSKLDIGKGHIYDAGNGTPTTPVPCIVRNYGTINKGTFTQRVFNMGTGTIAGGQFALLEGRNDVQKDNNNEYIITGGGTITGGYIHTYVSSTGTWGGEKVTVNGGIIYGKLDMKAGILKSGIVCSIPEIYKGDYQTLTAEGGIITPVVEDKIVPSDVQFQDKVYIVGNDNIMTRTFTIKPVSLTFEKWDYDEAAIAKIGGAVKEDSETHVLTVTLPENSTSSGNITIKAVLEPVTLEVGTINDNGTIKKVPIYKGEFYAGTRADGWHYDESTNTLTVYENGSINLGTSNVDWKIDNYGTIEGGVFNYTDGLAFNLTNEKGATIKGGTFNVRTYNYGTIDDGRFTNNVLNYGVVNGGTFTASYTNQAQTGTEDGHLVVLSNGYTYGGVFSHNANFSHDGIADAQDGVSITWITLNNCTANGISDMVGVVGNQTLTIEADKTSWKGWTANVESDLKYEEALKAKLPTTSSFELTVNGGTDPNFTLTAQVAEGYYRLNLVDGVATVNDKEVTSAKAGYTVKLTAADAPEGMVFDRWEITPTDAALKLEGFDASSATTSFEMPAQTLTIRAMYRMADVEEPNVLGTVAIVATAGVGAAVLGWTGYNIAADLYAQSILPEGTAIPETKEALAVMLWQNAGKPEVVAADGTALSETEQAQQWVVANGLMENEEDGSFHPEKGVGKFAALNAIKEQTEKANAQ